MCQSYSARLSLFAFMALCLIVSATQSFADSWSRQQQPSQMSDNAANNAPIPDHMMPSKQSNEDPSDLTLSEILAKDPSFSTLNKALASSGLMNTLSAPGPFTLFAPNDQAFAKLSPNTIDDLLNPENKTKLKALLTYHIIPGKINPDMLKNMKLKSLQGKILEIKVEGNKATVNNAKVVGEDKEGSNGIIYTIDTVLVP